MAYITISDLRPAGSDLFVDSESFMSELTDDELGLQGGGFWATVGTLVTSAPSIAISLAGAAIGLGIAYVVTR